MNGLGNRLCHLLVAAELVLPYIFSMKPSQSEQFTQEESTQRRNEVLRRMLNTPPQPHVTPSQEPKSQKKAEPPARKPRAGKTPS